jgi:hypothetical protein
MSTIEVVAFSGGSAKMGIYTREHCPPHATFRDQTGRWVVRISFSFLDPGVALMSIIPPQNSPGAGIVNELAQALLRNLSECRRLWWIYQQNNPLTQTEGPCCLNNQQRSGGVIVGAIYDPGACQTRIIFADGGVITVTV